MQNNQAYSLSALVADLDVIIHGDENCLIHGVNVLQDAQPGQIAFLTNPKYKKFLTETAASAVILTPADAVDCPITTIQCKNPHFIYAKIAEQFAYKETTESGIHSSSVIGSNCQIHPSARIDAFCQIGNDVQIGAHVHIQSNCKIGSGTVIDDHTTIHAGVQIYHHVQIGKRCVLASGVVVGSEGFGFANQQGQWHKVAQLGGVIIGDDVDIGANTTIDRGAVGPTIIEDGVKLDNLIQIAHNVKIGKHSIIAACVGIAGSTKIGAYCMIGGGACLAGHIEIADKVMITGMSAVTKSINTPGLYSSGVMGAVPNLTFKKNNARFHRLDTLFARVKELEMQVRQLTERE